MESAEIESIPLFAALAANERARVARAARPVPFDVGQAIVSEGDEPRRITEEIPALGEAIREVAAERHD